MGTIVKIKKIETYMVEILVKEHGYNEHKAIEMVKKSSYLEMLEEHSEYMLNYNLEDLVNKIKEEADE